MELTDEAINKALMRAGVPKIYRNKEMKLSDNPHGKQMLKFVTGEYGKHGKLGKELSTGSVLELLGSDMNITDLFYLTIRSLVISRCPIVKVNAMDLVNRDSEWVSSLRENMVLAIEGMTFPSTSGADALSDYRYTIEWQLIHWLNDGRGLLLLSDGEIVEDERWSERFRKLINSRKIDFDVSR